MIEWLNVNCTSCSVTMGKTPHLYHRINLEGAYSVFCFNCANLRERGIE